MRQTLFVPNTLGDVFYWVEKVRPADVVGCRDLLHMPWFDVFAEDLVF